MVILITVRHHGKVIIVPYTGHILWKGHFIPLYRTPWIGHLVSSTGHYRKIVLITDKTPWNVVDEQEDLLIGI